MGNLITLNSIAQTLANGDSLFLQLLPKYGYLAVLIAAFWEGEAVLIAAGTLCGAGYLDWRMTILLVCATVAMPPRKYSSLNLLSALCWASVWVAISYQFGAHL